MLIVERLHVDRGRSNVLSGVNIEATVGVKAVLGVNGAGKSTLFYSISGLHAFRGSISWRDATANISRSNTRAFPAIGFAPQDTPVTRTMSCHSLLTYLAVLDGSSRRDAERLADACLARVGLVAERDKRTDALSGGMRKRLGIAQALLAGPRILLLDEPTSGLDMIQRRAILDLIEELGRDCVVLFSTHTATDVTDAAESYVVLADGGVLMEGTCLGLETDALEQSISAALNQARK
jgi:ABC-2 type transport system ATP-binding protein